MPVRAAILGRPVEPLLYRGDPSLKPGDLVKVPLGSERVSACILEALEADEEGLKEVEELLLADLFPPNILKLADYMAQEQFCFVGEALELILPHDILLPPRRGITILSQPISRIPLKMRPDEAKLLQEIERSRLPLLVHSSADYTALVVELARRVIKAGNQVLLLFPHEPSLARAYERLHTYLPLSLYHSRMGQRERRRVWHSVRKGLIPLVAGLRSAVLLPFTSPGFILVYDEDSDSHRVRSHHLRYNAKDLALFRSASQGFPLVLFSLAPSLEASHKARSGKLLRIERRVAQRGKALIVDMRHEPAGTLISIPLIEEIKLPSEGRMQTLLILNRLGTAARLLCLECGNVLVCEACGIPLKFIRAGADLRCPVCSRSFPAPDRCPSCGTAKWQALSPGLEALKVALARRFPQARVLEITGEQRPLLEDVAQASIIYGTSAALEYLPPRVELAAFLSWDAERSRPDFRSAERAFRDMAYLRRILASTRRSRLLVQTYRPRDMLLSWAIQGDYESFFQSEVRRRRELGYPPYRRLVLFERRSKASWEPERLIDVLTKEGTEVLGPYQGRQAKTCILVKLRRDLSPSDLIAPSTLAKSGWQAEVDPTEIL